jgi:hypothetical protein
MVHSHEHGKAVGRANQLVAAQVEAARGPLSRQDWDTASTLLQRALAIEQATELDEARTQLTHVRQQQAARVLLAAEIALANRDAATALGLLRTYLNDPHGAEHARAASLKDALEHAMSDSEAIARLQRMPYAALVDLARDGRVADREDTTNPDVQAIHRDKLREHVAAELQRRDEEFVRRSQRIRATPVFSELQEFVALTRHRLLTQKAMSAIDYQLMKRLFRELNVNDFAEQQGILASLGSGRLDYAEAEKISRARANFKERFRAYKNTDSMDWEIFDRGVDQELDQLLRELQGTPNEGSSSNS